MSVEEIKFDCPECDESLAIDRRAIGHKVECPFCNEPIMVPEVPDAADPVGEAGAEESAEPGNGTGADAEAPVEADPDDETGDDSGAGMSLAELANSRPELGEKDAPPPAAAEEQEPAPVEPKTETPPAPPQGEAPVKKGGLPPKRKPGELPKTMAEDGPGARASAMPPPPGPPRQLPPPAGAPKPTPAAAAAKESAPAAPRPGDGGPVPEGYEERVRRKRKRRNPDDHRLNPREHPKMVAFDEVVDASTFRKHPGHGRMPWWKLLGVIIAIVGILGGIGLGILKQMELNEPKSSGEAEKTPMEIEFEAAKLRLDAFRMAPSLDEKMAYVRIPKAAVPGYPTLRARMNDYYTEYTLRPHFPNLDRASTEIVPMGDSDFLRISMTNNGIQSFLYFEKSAGGIALDWDSFVGYNPLDWTEFLVQPTEEVSVFRLILEPKGKLGSLAKTHFGRFQNEKRYGSYIAADLISASKAIAYVERDSPAGEAIALEFDKLRSRDEQRILVIAEVKYDERGVDGSHLTEIEKVLATSWLLP